MEKETNFVAEGYSPGVGFIFPRERLFAFKKLWSKEKKKEEKKGH